MKTVISSVLIICELLVLPTRSHAEGFYIGFILGAVSKGGLTIGYRFDEQNSMELHSNAVPDVSSYGIFFKHYSSKRNRDYALLGYSSVNGRGHSSKVDTTHGLNLGYGYRFGSDHEAWSYPVEIGGGPGYDFANEEFVPQFFVGGGALYGETSAKD
ncbi:hypothetical protein ACXWTF_12085 [Thiomicrolovo sp. ZZH C-3]